MKLFWMALAVASVLTGAMAQTPSVASSPWEKPAAALAGQIDEILGPGQARLTIRNLSTISNDEIPTIRRLLEQDLKTLGVLASGAESANEIRLTVSENQRGRVWVAEVVEGNETRVAMVEVKQGTVQQTQAESGVALRKQAVLTTRDEVLAALETADGLVVIEPEEIVIYGHSADGWQEQKRVGIGQKKPLVRDPRGIIVPTPSRNGFEASVAGMSCSGSYQPQPAQPTGEWTIQCRESDDPWPIFWAPVWQAGANAQEDVSVTPIKAFYNAARNYFTGILSPSLGPELPPFYTAAWLARPSNGAALLLGGVDGKLEILEDGALKPVAGARDWGSDFAALQPGCGAGAQIVASGSGEADSDSLRAFELPAQEAVPSSAPLAMDGTVTALWTALDGKSIFAVVRKAANPGATDRYEVARVTASCN
jgi:hypothetical protein